MLFLERVEGEGERHRARYIDWLPPTCDVASPGPGLSLQLRYMRLTLQSEAGAQCTEPNQLAQCVHLVTSLELAIVGIENVQVSEKFHY